MALGVFIPILIWVPKDDFVRSVVIGSILIVVSGLIDDIRILSAKQKIFPQIAAALVVILYGGVKITCLGALVPSNSVLPWFICIPLTLFVILGVTNAINLADGLDGLAGGISILTFVIIALLAYNTGNNQLTIMALAIVGAITGFLRYNSYPAILFMGDAGSQLLGFLSIVFAIVLTQSNTPYSKVLSLPLIGFPILDTLAVMIERIIKKRSPFAADKNHFHHRLLRFGFYHTEAVLIIYLIQACYISIALVFRFYSDWVHILGFTLVSSVILFFSFFARINNWKFRRDGSFDTAFKSRLKIVREKNIFIRFSFGGLRYGYSLLFAIQVTIPAQIPLCFSDLAIGLIILVAGSYYFKVLKVKEKILRFSIYLVTPLLLYMTESNPAGWIPDYWLKINNFGFIFLIFLVFLTLRLTRRTKGFKISPVGILVFIIILVFPNLPSMQLLEFDAGITLAKVLVIFFGYEVLMGELRGGSGFLAKSVICIFATLAMRGLIGL